MNIIEDTRNNLAEALRHYMCMRLQFRSSIMQDQQRKHLPSPCEEVIRGEQIKH